MKTVFEMIENLRNQLKTTEDLEILKRIEDLVMEESELFYHPV